ncbi:MAG: methyltransferase domain-containing protein [Chloroflexota bacterium]
MTSDPPRRFYGSEELARIGFDGRRAAEDLERWCCDGPRAETQELIDVLLGQGVAGTSLLDIGAGVGVVHMTLLEAGAADAVDVDASPDYIDAAREEADRRGLSGRVDYRLGDVVELAADLPPTDIVTADSVICCYPYLPELLGAAVRSGPRLVGLTYIHDKWWLRVMMRMSNAMWWSRGLPDRWSIHRHAEVDRLMGGAGYAVIHDGGTRWWRVVVYRRETASA